MRSSKSKYVRKSKSTPLKLMLENLKKIIHTDDSLSSRATTFVTVHATGKHREKTPVEGRRRSDDVLG